MKEITKTFISFKSKRQLPLIMVIRLYYKTKEDKKNNDEYFGEVLFSSDFIIRYIKRIIRRTNWTYVLLNIISLLFLTFLIIAGLGGK